MAHLVSTNGLVTGTRIPLNSGVVTVGRQPGTAIEIDDQKVSRNHAEIVRVAQGYEIRDLGSRNGTWVNDDRLEASQPRILRDGDRIRFVDTEYRFVAEGTVAKPPGPGGQSTDEMRIRGIGDDESSVEAVVVDDEEAPDESSSTILAKFEVTSGTEGSVYMTANLQARLNALLEITRNLGKALALDDVLPQVLNSLFKIFLQADRGFIVLKSDAGALVPRWTKARKASHEETVRISRTIVHHVMESREAILSNNVPNESKFNMSQSIAELRIRSMMCAPLLDSEGNPLGVIQVDTLDQRKGFKEEDLEVLASVAVQAGFAIHNAQLHEGALRQKELEQDLQLANEVQRAFLPQGCPELDGYAFFDFYKPANHVGGDYYDYVTLPDGRTAVIVADVVGHGVAAAMMMAKVSAEAKFCLASEDQPSTAITRLNERMSTMHIDRFVTLVMVVLDPKKHEVTIVNAGHMAPMWRRAEGDLAEPGHDLSGLPLGILGGLEYNQTTITLNPGDLLMMYTDGINESLNPLGKMYTIDRLRHHMQATAADPVLLGRTIIDDVSSHMSTAPQADDMCLVVLQRV